MHALEGEGQFRRVGNRARGAAGSGRRSAGAAGRRRRAHTEPGSRSNAAAQPGAQKKTSRPSNVRRAAADDGSTVMPQTGSRAARVLSIITNGVSWPSPEFIRFERAAMSQPTRYRATIAYVGTGFHGWQRQKNAPRTVQAVLEDGAGAPGARARARRGRQPHRRRRARRRPGRALRPAAAPRPRAVREAINGKTSRRRARARGRGNRAGSFTPASTPAGRSTSTAGAGPR